VYARDVPMHVCIREADILNTCCKFICIDIRTSR